MRGTTKLTTTRKKFSSHTCREASLLFFASMSFVTNDAMLYTSNRSRSRSLRVVLTLKVSFSVSPSTLHTRASSHFHACRIQLPPRVITAVSGARAAMALHLLASREAWTLPPPRPHGPPGLASSRIDPPSLRTYVRKASDHHVGQRSRARPGGACEAGHWQVSPCKAPLDRWQVCSAQLDSLMRL